MELINNSPYFCSPTRKEKELFLFCFSYPCLKDLKIQKREKIKKNFRKYLEDILKSFYLCIRFPEKKADIKEAIFEEIYINNTSSTRARLIFEKETVLGKIKRTVITY